MLLIHLSGYLVALGVALVFLKTTGIGETDWDQWPWLPIATAGAFLAYGLIQA